MVFGAVDLLRQPAWAWRAAGEPKIVCLAPGPAAPGRGTRHLRLRRPAEGRRRSPPADGPPASPSSASATGPSRPSRAAGPSRPWPGPPTRGSFGEPITRTDPGHRGTAGIRRATLLRRPRRGAGRRRARVRRGGRHAPAPVAVETVTDPAPESDHPHPGRRRAGPTTRGSAPRSTRGRSRGPSLATVAADVAVGGRGGGGGAVGRHAAGPPAGRCRRRCHGGGLPSMPAPRVGTSVTRDLPAPARDRSPPSPAPRRWPPRRWPPWPPAG